MSNSKSIVFFGNERLSSAINYTEAPLMQMLLSQKYNIEALIIKNKETKSRSLRELAILGLAKKHTLNVVKINTLEELEQVVSGLKSELAILASFGFFLNDKILQHFSLGIINVHPSLLPLHRGSTPIENALLKGDLETGISLMEISDKLDAGNIYAQEKLAIETDDTKLQLTHKLGVLAAQMLQKNLPLILQQQLEPVPQDHQKATYSDEIKSNDVLYFKQHSATYLKQHIRAFMDCPNNKFYLNKYLIEIKAAQVFQSTELLPLVSYNKQAGLIYVKCKKDYLAIERLQPANRREMSASEFVNGFYQELS